MLRTSIVRCSIFTKVPRNAMALFRNDRILRKAINVAPTDSRICTDSWAPLAAASIKLCPSALWQTLRPSHKYN